MTIIDMHIHLKNRSPCSIIGIEQLMASLSQKISGICITDHWKVSPIKNLSNYGFKVFFGMEITSEEGDILAYGIKNVPSRILPAQEVIDIIHKQGGVAVCAHPFSSGHMSFYENFYDFNFDAIEINGAMGKRTKELASKAAKISELPTIGGSDAHSVKQLNSMGTKFSVSIRSVSDIVEAIKTKKCRAIRI